MFWTLSLGGPEPARVARTPYSSDVMDEESDFLLPNPRLANHDHDAPQREHDLPDVFDAMR
jgi:hypothetical protein